MIAPNPPYTRGDAARRDGVRSVSAYHTPDPGTVRAKTSSDAPYLSMRRRRQARRVRSSSCCMAGSAPARARRTRHASPLSEREGFVVVYPTASSIVPGTTAAKRARPPISTSTTSRSSLPLIDTMVRERNVDPEACVRGRSERRDDDVSPRVRALREKITGRRRRHRALPENGAAECKPSHPMPLVMFSARRIPLVPYRGGGGRGRSRPRALGDRHARALQLNGCGPAQPLVHATTGVPDDGTSITETLHTGCAEVRLFEIEGGGRTWPGGPQYLPKSRIGRVSKELDLSEEL